ncbi:MAG: hypothetical protein WCC84_08015 [Candidatus Cybelea sp.]
MLIRGTAVFPGRQISSTVFKTCLGTTITIVSGDQIKGGGSCDTDSSAVASSAQRALSSFGLSGAKVDAISKSGTAALATFNHGNNKGQVLLVRGASGNWVPATITSGQLQMKDFHAAGVGTTKATELRANLAPPMR